MKKVLAMVLALMMLIPLGLFGVNATDPMDSHKLLHYDFNEADPKTNKGTLGSEANLQQKNSVTYDQTQGVVKNAANGGVYCPGALVADVCAGGLYDATSNPKGKGVEFTMFVRFKLDSDVTATTSTSADTFYSIVEMRSFNKLSGSTITRPLSILYVDARVGNQDQIRVSMQNSDNCGTGTTINKNLSWSIEDAKSRYVNLALVVRNAGTAEAPNYEMRAYTSTGSSEEAAWTLGANATIGTGVAALNTNLWLMSDGSGDPAGLIVDDFRLYDTVYNMSQLISIMASGSFDRDDILFKGAQTAKYDGNYSVRFLGSVDALDYDKIGVEITNVVGGEDGKTVSRETNKVFLTVLEAGNPVTADSCYCSYFSAFLVEDIPMVAVTFKVRFYTVQGTTVLYSDYHTVSIGADGEITSVA